MHLRPATVTDLDELVQVWEASVRATHHFLPVTEIEILRPLMRDAYLPSVDILVSALPGGPISGFIGTRDDAIEMLFVAPDHHGQGIGSALLASTTAHAVDVNEQNAKASAFYQRRGFEVVGRSAVDGQGRPYPLLHLRRA